jgi:hypothetical protein
MAAFFIALLSFTNERSVDYTLLRQRIRNARLLDFKGCFSLYPGVCERQFPDAPVNHEVSKQR